MRLRLGRTPGRRTNPLIVGMLGIALGAGVLSACGGGSGGDAGDALTTKQTITVWTWDQPGDGLKAAVPGFQKKYPNVTVDVQNVGNPAIWDKITTGMAAGGAGLADVMNVGGDYMGNYIETFPKGFADLGPLGADALKDDYAPSIWAGGSDSKGTVFGLPIEVNASAVFYRKDIFDQAGVDMSKISTWDDLLQAGTTLKQKTGYSLLALDKAASESDAANTWQLLARLEGTFFFNQAGDISLNDAGSVKALEFLKKANQAGLIADVPGGWDNFIGELKGSTKVAVVPGAAWVAGVFAENAPALKGKWAIRNPPAMEPGGQTAALAGANYLTVSGSSKHQKAAAEFVKYALGTLEGQQAVYQGSGLFPAFKPMYATAEFKSPSAYFGGEDVNKFFVDELNQNIAPANYTKDYAKALKAFTDAQTDVLLKDKDPKTALDAAAKLLAQQTNRKIAGQ